jgi:hypothetical protein
MAAQSVLGTQISGMPIDAFRLPQVISWQQGLQDRQPLKNGNDHGKNGGETKAN